MVGLVGFDEVGHLLHKGQRVFDGAREGDGAGHVTGVALEIGGGGGGAVEALGEAIPAAGDFDGVVELEGVAAVGKLGFEYFADVFFIHGEDEDFVIG